MKIAYYFLNTLRYVCFFVISIPMMFVSGAALASRKSASPYDVYYFVQVNCVWDDGTVKPYGFDVKGGTKAAAAERGRRFARITSAETGDRCYVADIQVQKMMRRGY
jgi:hypothetical protein